MRLENKAYRILMTPNASEHVEFLLKLSFFDRGNAKWYNHFGIQFGGFMLN